MTTTIIIPAATFRTIEGTLREELEKYESYLGCDSGMNRRFDDLDDELLEDLKRCTDDYEILDLDDVQETFLNSIDIEDWKQRLEKQEMVWAYCHMTKAEYDAIDVTELSDIATTIQQYVKKEGLKVESAMPVWVEHDVGCCYLNFEKM